MASSSALAGLPSELPAGLDIQIDLAPGTPAVLCDEAQIEFVLEQMVRNAAEAAGPQGDVLVALRATSAGVEVAVEDDGDGMEQRIVDEVCDPFSVKHTAGSAAGLAGQPQIRTAFGGRPRRLARRDARSTL